MALKRCPLCKELDLFGSHQCPPRFDCVMRWAVENILGCAQENEINQMSQEQFDELEWQVVYARDAEEAAEKYCARCCGENYDGEGEYSVYVKDGLNNIKRFEITAELTMSYRANWRSPAEIEMPEQLEMCA
jgi:hypothetical protein